MNEAAELSPTQKLLEQEKRLEDCLQWMDQTFGTIGHPDHDPTKFYMKGRLDGIRYTMAILDI